MAKSTATVLLFVCLVAECSALRITRIRVPERVALGDTAKLECEWVSDLKQIYSLKWYFGLEEFYRWTPADSDPVQVFTVQAFDVVKEESKRGTVTIKNLSRAAEGTMRCEISEEAPTFHTAAKVGNLEVVDVPDSPPLIGQVQQVYQLHQQVALNCTSLHSKPPPTLSFFVNNEPANPSWVGPPEVHTGHTLQGGHRFPLYTATRQLRFRLLPRLISSDGRVLVKCTAEIPGIYWETNEVALPVDLPQRASIMEGRSSSVTRCCTGLASTSLPLLLLWRLQHWQHMH